MIQTIGRYRVVEKIGQGGMGVVYKAFDPLLERTVAVKVLSGLIDKGYDAPERLLREARAAGQLTHRNIIVIHDLGEEAGQPYLAMEFLTGESIEALIQRGPLSLDDAMDLVIQVCHGLEHAHRHGIVHRDIKPANLFRTEAGEVKILDFGLVRLKTSSLTRSQSILGTVNYMSPEQVRGERVDHRADIFAVGSVLYELITRQKAFHGDSFAATMYKILQEAPEPPERFMRDLPPSLGAIVGRALTKEPDQRYQNAGDMALDLAACRASLAGHPSAATPGTMRPHAAAGVAVSSVSHTPQPLAAPPSVAWSPRRLRTTAVIGVMLTMAFVGTLLWSPDRDRDRQAPGSNPTASNQAVSAPVVNEPPKPPTASQSTSAGPGANSSAPQAPIAPPSPAAPERPRAAAGDSPAAGVQTTPATSAAGRQALTDALSRLAETRASAETVDAPTLAAAQYRAAVALEIEARQLAEGARASDAMARIVQADATFRAAAIEARAEAAARERLRAAEKPAAPVTEPRSELPPASPRADPRPPVRTPAIAPPADAEASVREAIAQYVAGLEGRNIAVLKRVWPTLSAAQERAIQGEFQNARSVQVRFADTMVSVNGDAATVTGTREYSLMTQDGQRLSTVTRTTITLRRSGDAWLIDRVVHQPR